jgi:prevent-host-death family protein
MPISAYVKSAALPQDPARLSPACATLSHVEVGVRELRNNTAQVIEAVRSGEVVTLTVHGEPVADIVPHVRRTRWLDGNEFRRDLADQAADPALASELDALVGQTLAEL